MHNIPAKKYEVNGQNSLDLLKMKSRELLLLAQLCDFHLLCCSTKYRYNVHSKQVSPA